MYSATKTACLCIILSYLFSCKTAKNAYYSYNIATYTIDSLKHFHSFSSWLSYGDFLFEYRIRTTFLKEMHGDEEPVKSVVYDTIGVYLVSGKDQQYYEFDSFALKSKIIKYGPLSEKESGGNFSTVKRTDSSDTYYGPTEEVLINGIPCFYSSIISKKQSPADTVEQKVVLIKNEHLNSFYKIKGVDFSNKEYCIVGMELHLLTQNESLVEEIKNLRPLTAKEKQICRSMLKASGL